MSDTQLPLALVVDDDAAARRMMRRALERRGYRVIERTDGASGLAALSDERPDIVLLDLRMPGELSGIDATRMAKADPVIRHIPIVIVSASVHADARQLTDESGCDGFVEKPVDFALLEQEMSRVLGGSHER